MVGGSGFIGRNFLWRTDLDWGCVATFNTSTTFESFLEQRCLSHVKAIKVNLSDKWTVNNEINKVGNKFDVCLYVAGNSDIGLSRREPISDLSSNVCSLINVLESVHVNKFIFMSSGAVYEGYSGLVNPSLPVNPTIPYAISKLMSERYINYFQKCTDHINSYICLRFFGCYGFFEPARKIFTKLIKELYINKNNNYTIVGDGKNYIDAMYIDDTISGLLKIIESDKENKIVDFCFGQPLTINELVSQSAQILTNKQVKITHIGSPSEYTTFYASPLEMESLFGFRPRLKLSEGLKMFSELSIRQEV